ncbi:MAG: acylphosphatase [Bacteroidales bacterium]|nr:acylphosphatase [Bacteroidales bacterium]MCF8351819.1 acylphosphatase [Bacteroidales bacterium]
MAKTGNIKTKSADRKDVLKIQLNGSLSSDINYVFEIYRQAVMNNLAGYVEKQTINSIEMILSGEGNTVDHFILWLKKFVGQSVNINIEKKPNQILYNEFRIISSDKNKMHNI